MYGPIEKLFRFLFLEKGTKQKDHPVRFLTGWPARSAAAAAAVAVFAVFFEFADDGFRVDALAAVIIRQRSLDRLFRQHRPHRLPCKSMTSIT